MNRHVINDPEMTDEEHVHQTIVSLYESMVFAIDEVEQGMLSPISTSKTVGVLKAEINGKMCEVQLRVETNEDKFIGESLAVETLVMHNAEFN